MDILLHQICAVVYINKNNTLRRDKHLHKIAAHELIIIVLINYGIIKGLCSNFDNALMEILKQRCGRRFWFSLSAIRL